jgi:hypothetical protein
MPYLDGMHPVHLALDPSALFTGLTDFGHPLFDNLTHFDIVRDNFAGDYTAESWKGLASLPSLTHLSFNCRPPHYFSTTLEISLRECKLLKSLIISIGTEELAENQMDEPWFPSGFPTQDPRFVMAEIGNYEEDWRRGAWGGADFWVRADKFIRLKRQGDIPSRFSILSLQYHTPHWPFTEDCWLLRATEYRDAEV